MAIQRSTGEKLFEVFNIAFMLLLILITLYPFTYVAFASISDPTQIIRHTGILLTPLGFTLDAYKAVMKNPSIFSGYMNTLFVVSAGTVFNVLLTTLGAYVLSRKGFYIRDALMFLIVFTMFFSGGLIPTYLIVKAIHITDTRLALILPTAINTFNLIILRTAFASVPDSMEESAKLDGANDFIILFRIIIPLCLPTMAVIVLYYGVGHWNAWFNAMIYLRKRGLYPLQLILREILIASSTDDMTTSIGGSDKLPVGETIKYATIIVATVPILFIYPFLQRYFVKGVMVGAIKG